MPDASDLIRQAAQAKQENRFAEAKQQLLQATILLREQPANVDLGHALRLLGEVERKLCNGDAARLHYEEAVAILRQHDDAILLAHTVRHLGDVHHDAGRDASAEPCYREALELYRGHPEKSPLDLANAIRSLAVLMGETGQVGEARALWEEARDLYAQVNVAAGVEESTARLLRLSA